MYQTLINQYLYMVYIYDKIGLRYVNRENYVETYKPMLSRTFSFFPPLCSKYKINCRCKQ